MIQVEYWNSNDIIDAHYDAFRNRFWLQVNVTKPKYPIKVEASENSYGDTTNEYQRWDKQYSFEVWGTETMADFLSLIPLHDNIWITNERGLSTQALNFAVEVDWGESECVAKCTCTFNSKSYSLSGNAKTGVC